MSALISASLTPKGWRVEQWRSQQRGSEWTTGIIRSTRWNVTRAVPALPPRRACPSRLWWVLFTSSSMKTTPAASSSGTSVSLLNYICFIRINAICHMFPMPHAPRWGVYIALSPLFRTPQKSTMWILFSAFSGRENWVSDRLNNLPRTSQLATQTQLCPIGKSRLLATLCLLPRQLPWWIQEDPLKHNIYNQNEGFSANCNYSQTVFL